MNYNNLFDLLLKVTKDWCKENNTDNIDVHFSSEEVQTPNGDCSLIITKGKEIIHELY